MTTTPRHPVFCYGTLRIECGNDRLWHGRAVSHHDGTAYVLGYALVTNGAFPYLVPATMSQTVGALIVPHDDDYDDVLEDMDGLEGVPVHYERIEVAVLTPTGPTMAWTYVPAARTIERIAELPDVPTDEWGRHDWSLRTPRRFTYRT